MKTTRTILPAVLFFASMTVLTGIVYPLLVTGIAAVVFPVQAGGSLIRVAGDIRGSALIAQDFTSDKFFQGRPSAASFATVPSGASNAGPLNRDLASAVAVRAAKWREQNGDIPAPPEMLYASGSGLDPDISLAAALAQVARVAAARGFDDAHRAALIEYIKTNPEAAELFPAPERINVLLLNLALETDPRFTVH